MARDEEEDHRPRSEAAEGSEDDLNPDPTEAVDADDEAVHDEDDDRIGESYSVLVSAVADEETSGNGSSRKLSPEEQLRRGEEHMKHGQVSEALHHYREAVRGSRSVEEDTEHRTTLGDAYAYSGQGLNAFRQYRRAIKNAPRKAEPHFSLAELYQRYGRLQSAIVEFRKAVTFAPQNAYYRYKLGEALAQTGDLEAAVSELEECTLLKPQDGFYHFWLGDMYARAGRWDEAVREMQQATLFSPYDAYYNVRLGILYRRSGQMKDAALAVRQAVQISPDNGAYHCLLADFYSELHLEDRAIFHYQAAGTLDDYDIAMLTRLRAMSGMDDDYAAAAALDAPEDFDYGA
jgi:Flp pilus assembly protein TadD